MSRMGNCWDNAPVESFFSTFKAEAVPDRPWIDADEAVSAIAEYIDFYNRRRQHSSLDYQSPTDFEANLKAPPYDR
jgi:transposase InsO family protein